MSLEEQAQGIEEMNRTAPHQHHVCALQAMILLALSLPTYGEQLDTARYVKTVQHSLTLASRMIEKIEGSDRLALAEELESLQTRFLENIDKKLAADSSAFFQHVMQRYKARLNVRPERDDALHRARYEEKMTELESFRRAFDGLVEERGDVASNALNAETFNERMKRALQLAGSGQYEDAYSFADGAYHQLIEALKRIQDNETIEYKLEFASVADEYEYEIRRFHSQKMLLDMIVAERDPGPGSLKLITNFVDSALAKTAQAGVMARSGGYSEALARQEAAVEELTKAMRIAGIYF